MAKMAGSSYFDIVKNAKNCQELAHADGIQWYTVFDQIHKIFGDGQSYVIPRTCFYSFRRM